MPIGVGMYFIRDDCTDPLLQYSDIQPTENGILASAEYEVDTAISKFQTIVGDAARAWRTVWLRLYIDDRQSQGLFVSRLHTYCVQCHASLGRFNCA
jgi:hypothetical protein